MRIEQALRTYLLTRTGLTALISTRISADEVSKGLALPCVVFFKVSDVVDHTLTGQEKLARPVFQFSAYALTKDEAMDIAEQLEAALADYVGTLSGVQIQYVALQNRFSSKESMADGTGKYFIEDLEFEVNYIKE